jgi:hypothetical protein
MQWRFQLSGIPNVETNLNTMLQIENGDQTAIITLKNDAITIAQKTLGPWKLAARDQIKQVSVLTNKSNEYSQIIMASPGTWVDNWTAYYSVYLPKMTFILFYRRVTYQKKTLQNQLTSFQSHRF